MKIKLFTRRRVITSAVLLLCGLAYARAYTLYGLTWHNYKPPVYSDQQNIQDPGGRRDKADITTLAYKNADMPSLIVGFKQQADKQYVGTPVWQHSHDLFGIEPPRQAGKMQFLYYRRFLTSDGSYRRGMALFRFETMGDRPVQVLGLQRLAYHDQQKRIVSDGLPLPIVVSAANGRVSYDDMAQLSDLAMIPISKTGMTAQGYERTDGGVLSLHLPSNDRRLALHYLAALTPPNGECVVGQPTPCRMIRNQLHVAWGDRDLSSADMPSLILQTQASSEQAQRNQHKRLKYEPSQHRYLLPGMQGIEQIEALSPAAADAFLATLPTISG